MTSTTSERAISASGLKPHRVACPNCTATFDLNKIGKPRSPDQHKRFFAVVSAAFDQWPESSDFQPDSKEHLRAWLICKASPQHRTVDVTNAPDTGDPVMNASIMLFMEEQLEREPGFKFSRWRGMTITTFRPKSIRWDKMKHLTFCDLNNAVDEVIQTEIGITADELLSNGDSA